MTPRSNASLFVGVAALVLGLALTSWVMWLHGYSIPGQLALGAFTVLGLLAPGWTLSGWSARSPWPARISAALVCGVPVQLLGWLLTVSTGIPALLWLVPVAVALGVGAALRRQLRDEFRHRRPSLPAWASVTLLAVWAVALIQFQAVWTRFPTGEWATRWDADSYWHLGIHASALHRVPLLDPQANGEYLLYHWFSNAHAAGIARATGIDIELLVVGGWSVLAMAATAGLALGLTHHLSRRTWAGVLAAGLTVLPPMFALDRVMDAGTTASFELLSPSHVFALPLLAALAWLIVVVLKAGRRRQRLALPALVALVLLAPGAKISLLPVVLCGLAAALAVALVTRRRRRVTAALLLGVILTAALTYPVFGGGGGGSEFDLFGSQYRRAVYSRSYESVNALDGLSRRALVLGYVGLLLLNHLWAATGLAAVRWRDPISWFLGGICASAVGVTLVLIHPSNSQNYFALGVQPILAVACALGMARLVREVPVPVALLRWLLLGSGAVGLLVGMVVMQESRVGLLTRSVVFGQLGLLAAVALLVGVLGWRFGWRPVLAVAGAFLLGFSLGFPAAKVQQDLRVAGWTQAELYARFQATGARPFEVNADEMAAARWVAANTHHDDVLATNVHCRDVVTTENCDGRAFWVAGLTQRQLLLGSWPFTNLGRSTHRSDGLKYVFQPYPDRELFELNETAFKAPNAQVMADLGRLGVDHLFADSRAGHVSPALSQWCEVTYSNDTVTVCRIPR